MRRRVGVGAVQKSQLTQARFKDIGTEIADDQMQFMGKQMEQFRDKLQEFASKYKKEIRKNPQFRKQFQEMCATVGVDPLASSKGFWANMLGVGDFYYELGVQIIEVCLATRGKNGGIMSLEELREKVSKSRSNRNKQETITNDDIMRAVDKVKILGEGFRVIPTQGRYIIQSVPAELSMDHTSVLELAEKSSGYTSITCIRNNLKWTDERAKKALEDLVKESLAWVDDQAKERLFWFPGLVKNLNEF